MYAKGPVLLARYLALAWLGLLIYGSLHPFVGWRDTGISPFAFFEGGWPRYWTVFDLAANVLAYLPLGFLLTLGLGRLPGRFTAALICVLIGSSVSFGLECLQTWLPSRVPSNLDFACNSFGNLLGALLALRAGPLFFTHLVRWQNRIVAPVPHAELGLTLLGLWLLIPLSPEILLFGAGDLRAMLDLPLTLNFSAGNFSRLESAVVACNLIAVGLLVRLLVAGNLLVWLIVPLFLLLGLLVRTLGTAILVGPEQALDWWTPGVQRGLLTGVILLLPGLMLPAKIRPPLAALALMAGTIFVNLAPINPYSQAALAAWQQGHFLNFNGLTRLVSVIWPFLVLTYLMLATRRD